MHHVPPSTRDTDGPVALPKARERNVRRPCEWSRDHRQRRGASRALARARRHRFGPCGIARERPALRPPGARASRAFGDGRVGVRGHVTKAVAACESARVCRLLGARLQTAAMGSRARRFARFGVNRRHARNVRRCLCRACSPSRVCRRHTRGCAAGAQALRGRACRAESNAEWRNVRP